LRQRKVAGLAYDSEHAKLWQDIKADLDKTRARASKFADAAEWAFGKRTARVFGIVMLFAVVVTLLLVFLDWYIAPTKPGDKKDLVLALAQILAGTALLSGLYFTWRGQRLTQKGQEETQRLTEQGQITERFTRAIEQLGATPDDKSKNLELRLGGIYALERIAKESEEDHWSIMEVLTAYVRQHARAPCPKESEPREVPAPGPDIQAIMTVIRRRTRSFGHGEPDPLDLGDTNLSGVNLWRSNLTGANLVRGNLLEANLTGANLVRVNLTGADLSGADLSGADLSRANLTGAFLDGADLSRADLSRADLWRSNLTGADLSRANLTEAKHLKQEQLEKTMSGDENTRLPPGLKPPADWNVKTDEQIEGS
jgi:hypothetical protein